MRSGVQIGALAVLLGAIGGPLFAQGVRPTPTIQVRVVDESGAPIDAGRAVIDSIGRWALIEKGLATIADLSPGKLLVSLRALGFAPESITVEATTAQPSAIPVVTMRRIAQKLSAIEVTATLTSKDSARLRDIDQRMRVANGTLIMSDNLAVRNATRAADALGVAKGFRWKSSTVVEARGGVHGSCRSFPRADSLPRRGEQVVAIYLDGSRLHGGLDAINQMVPPSDILAIEAYPDANSAPFLWRTRDACAVVAFWTKRPPTVSR